MSECSRIPMERRKVRTGMRDEGGWEGFFNQGEDEENEQGDGVGVDGAAEKVKKRVVEKRAAARARGALGIGVVERWVHLAVSAGVRVLTALDDLAVFVGLVL